MHLRTARTFKQVFVILAVARLYETLGLIKGTDLIVVHHNLGACLDALGVLNQAHRKIDRITRAYLKLIERAEVHGLASVQADRWMLRRRSRRLGRKVRRVQRSLTRLPWPARFFEGLPFG